MSIEVNRKYKTGHAQFKAVVERYPIKFAKNVANITARNADKSSIISKVVQFTYTHQRHRV